MKRDMVGEPGYQVHDAHPHVWTSVVTTLNRPCLNGGSTLAEEEANFHVSPTCDSTYLLLPNRCELLSQSVIKDCMSQ